MNWTDLSFWFLLLLINSFYFLPGYLLEAGESDFFPWRMFVRRPLYNRLRHLLIRPNYDIFRVCVDLWVLSFAYVFILKDIIHPVPFFVLFFLFTGATLIYQIYHNVFEKLYYVEPVMFNDSFMLRNAFSIFFHEYDRKNFLITVIALAFAACLAVICYWYVMLLTNLQSGEIPLALMIVLGLCALFSLWHYDYRKYTKLTFQSPLQSMIRNSLRSMRAKRELARLKLHHMKAFNPSGEERLREKPNIYLIVVESYGRIVMDYPGFSDAYLEHLKHCRDKLETHGFHACSRFSLSPVTGGASWISYTSVMYGLNVKAQSVFLALMKNKHIHEYRSLFWWLKDRGYTTYRLSNLGGYETMKIPYDEYSRMYGFDHWITYQDLGYKGKHYGFGPSPPDQYAIWYADQQITAAGTEPFALFFITQNSHTPYESPEKAVDDWRLLLDPGSEMKAPSKFWSKPDFGLYLDAIKYQLDYLTDFICKTGNERDIFILIGDHQPPSLSIPIDNFDTPLHIISKDKEFTELWSEYNFSPGLLCDPALDPIRHEALYTALRRTLIKRFGKKDAPLPVYLPKGIPYPA